MFSQNCLDCTENWCAMCGNTVCMISPEQETKNPTQIDQTSPFLALHNSISELGKTIKPDRPNLYGLDSKPNH